MKKIYKLILGLSMIAGIFISCKTTEKAGMVYIQPDYTEEDVRSEEVKRIKEIAQTNLIQAYWRSILLDDKTLIEEIENKVFDDYKKSIEKKNYLLAEKNVKALESFGSKLFDQCNLKSEDLKKLATESFVANSSSKKIEKVSELIEGTVTVWVDKGIKVENGMGYADRVIGSGFFISKDGYIVTNHHVIADLVDPKYEGYARLFVKLAQDSETRIPAKVIGYDSSIDLAVLKAEVEAPFVFKLGSSEDLDVGDKIFCIGSPIGLERTLTSGIVSARDRVLFSAAPVMQIDAAVNSGNSGGPCVDQNGNVQAIVFAGMLQFSGLNFAIPVEYLKVELPYLLNGGELKHSWIQANGRTKKINSTDFGVEINYVMPGGSAFRAGLKEGDLITSIEGQKVSNLEELQKKLIGIPSNSILSISYKRGDEAEKTVTTFASERPENPGFLFFKNDVIKNSFTAIFGMKLEGPVQNKKKYKISQIIKGSIADESGFSEEDPIEIMNIDFNQEQTAIFIETYAKKRKKGYLDINIGMSAMLDSPNYF